MLGALQGGELLPAAQEDSDQGEVHLGADQFHSTQPVHSNQWHPWADSTFRNPSRKQSYSFEIRANHEEVPAGTSLYHTEHD